VNLVDTNVLVFTVNEASPQHADSRRWLDGVLSGADTLALSWQALIGFVRVVTHPAVASSPLDVGQAFDLVDAWLAAPASIVVEPTATHTTIVRDLLIGAGGVGGKLVHDAHLAALAIEHRAGIVSYDSDFARFPGVAWSPPG
jgi:toxin-antitoxin system PIN domain toxin